MDSVGSGQDGTVVSSLPPQHSHHVLLLCPTLGAWVSLCIPQGAESFSPELLGPVILRVLLGSPESSGIRGLVEGLAWWGRIDGGAGDGSCHWGGSTASREPGLPEKKWALKPFLETVLSDLNSTRMLLYWEVMTSGFSEPQNLPCSLESAVSPLRTSTKSYLHTWKIAQLRELLLSIPTP